MPLRSAAARADRGRRRVGVGPAAAHAAGGCCRRLRQRRRLGDKVHKRRAAAAQRDPPRSFTAAWSRSGATRRRWSSAPASRRRGHRATAPALRGLRTIERMMALDMLGYLPDDILAKVDRAAMAVSLETRVPLLDHRRGRIRLAPAARPQDPRRPDANGCLRQLLYRHVPRELIERPKMGFGVPIDAWLRGPLRDWAEALLDERRLREEGFFAPEPIRAGWEAHLGGRPTSNTGCGPC